MGNEKEISSAKLIWKMTRPHTLTATFSPVILGTVASLYVAKIDWLLFIAMMLACLALQIATNLFNEYYDFKRGLDTAESVGIGGGIVRHGLKPKNVLTVALLLYVVAAFIGIYICMNSSWWLVVIGLIGMAVGYLYTGGPLPIAYTPFGELVSGLLMGTCFVLIAFFIQTNTVTIESVLISIPIGILVGAINMSNNIRDIEEDIKGGRKTLVILLGREKAVVTLAVAFFHCVFMDCRNCINGLYKPLGISYVLRFEKANFCDSKFPKRGKGSWIYAHRNEINSDDKYDFRLLVVSRIIN
ncbi:1,4-dihydroxy-2-naphthoate polyprenyltransferase [Bacillus cereus]